VAGASDDRPPRTDGPAADAARPAAAAPRSSPAAERADLARGDAPEEEARWTSLAGWADVTPTGLRVEDIDPEITPRGSLRLAPLNPPAAFGPRPPAGPPAWLGPPAPPAAAAPARPTVAAPVRASAPPAAPAARAPSATGWPVPSPWPQRPSGAPAPPGMPGPVTHAPWAGGAGPMDARASFPRRRPVLTAAAASVVLLLVSFGLAWVAVAPSCCSDSAPQAAAAVPAGTPAADGGWTAGQRALARRLDPAVLLGCRPNPAPAGAGVTASIFCATAEGRQVAVYAYRDADALRSDVTQRANGVPSEGRCEGGADEVFSWDTGPGTPTGGTVVCHHRDGRAFLFWSSDADNVSFLAYDADARSLVDWWESFQPFPDRDRPTAAPRPA